MRCEAARGAHAARLHVLNSQSSPCSQDELTQLSGRLADAASRWPAGCAPSGDGSHVRPPGVLSLRSILLRLNSQTRPVAEVLPEVLPVSYMDRATGKAAVPSLEKLLRYRVSLASRQSMRSMLGVLSADLQ